MNEAGMSQLNLGKLIKQARIDKNISQKELADEFGVTSSAISAWERNKTTPPAYVLIELAKKLEIVDEIFGRSKTQSRQDEISDIWDAIKEIREKVGL